jgi:proline dehydrogenase
VVISCISFHQLQLSEVLARVRRYYETLASGYGTGKLQKADFERHLKSFKMGREERQKWFTILDVTNDG